MKFHFDILAPIYEIIIPPVFPEELLNILGDLENKKILEVGGGTGRLAQYFTSKTKNVWVMDPSVQMLYKALKSERKLKLVHGYAEKQPFPNDFFDLVIAVDSLHHWDNQEEGIKETFRVLKEGGKFFVGEIHPKHKLGHFIVTMEKSLFMKSRFFTPKKLIELLKSNGFKIENIGWLKHPTYFISAIKPSK